jgi:uncharacterized membrane protein YeaQ/YmgE (transglycosylase-associated protein family)
VFGFLLYLIFIGIVAGYIGRLLVPGTGGLGFLKTVGLGIVGSFIGGWLGYLLFDVDFDEGALQASGIFGSIIGAVIAILVYTRLIKKD